MVPRIALAMIALAVLTYGLALKAQEGTGPKTGDAAQIKEELSLKEQILARQYQEFEQQLLRLKQRMERSGKQEDRDRALVLDRVLDYCKDKSISVSFEQLVDTLKSKELKSLPDIKQALERSSNIADDLREIITMLREDTRASSLRKQADELRAILKKLEVVIQNQQSVQAQTENKKTDKTELGKIQASVSKSASEIAQILGGKGGKDEKNTKGDPKPAGKNGEKAGEAKNDGEKPPAKAQAKEGGEGKEPKGTAKSGEPGKEGQPKEGKGAEGAQAKEAGKSGEGSKGDPKPGSEGKPGEGGKGKQGQAKAGESSKGQSQAKGDGESPPSSSPPQASNKGDGGKKNPNQQVANPPKDNPANGKKQVEEAYDKMKQAEAKIEEQKNDDASNDQAKAIEKLKEAQKNLEKLLRQIREEELERLLANLQVRCEKMLAMQIQVLVATESLDKLIAGQLDKQPDRTNKADSLKLSDNEGDIVLEASKAIEILEAEGSAVAFPEVFQQVREDMKHTQRRLGITDTAEVTQGIERDIIDSLKEMIEALKKAKKDLADSKANPPPPGSPPPNQDQKLLEKIAELKMIRSMQIRVNGRTQTYGKMYQGEQTVDPNIRRELHNLSERQERIFEVTNRMAKGDNR